jgi:hypothetical protein
MTFPNFLIIGANKGGTSSFYVYLSRHPEIFMSEIKEPMFFLFYDEEKKEKAAVHEKEPEWVDWKPISDLGEYKKMFNAPAGVKAAGEASTAYLANPVCAARIYKFNPGMKIIVILRNPVSRAFSNYLMYVRLGHEKKAFRTVVKEELGGKRAYLPQGRHYLQLGYYHDSLKTYIDQFGKENVKVYLIEELKERPEWLFEDVFTFLGVDPSYKPDVSEKFNVNEKVIRLNLYGDLIKRAVNSVRYSRFVPRFIKRYLNAEIRIDAGSKEQLKRLYREDILNVQKLIGKDLSAWLK